MKRLFSLLCIAFLLISLFNSCQKEEYRNQHLELIMDTPVNTGGTTWQFSGKVLSSGKVDIAKYGFEMKIGSESVKFEENTLTKVGKVTIIRELPGGVTPVDVVFYAVDNHGQIYTSRDASINEEVPVTITSPHHTSDLSYEYFSATINNPFPGAYVVFDYGIDFRLESATEYTQGFQFVLPGDNFNTTISAYREIDGTSGTFMSGQEYRFRFYAKVRRLSDGTITKVYSSENTFTAIML